MKLDSIRNLIIGSIRNGRGGTDEKPTSGEAGKKMSFDLADDVYKPSMKTSAEHLKPGTEVLRDGWSMLSGGSTTVQKEAGLRNARLPSLDDKGWKSVVMPSQWAVADPDLFASGGSIWYKKRFTVTAGQAGPGKHMELTFKGVDYFADVYLNGEKLGSHEGYFEPFSFGLDGKVKAGEKNTLLVKVSAPDDSGSYHLKSQMKGVFGHHDCRPGGKSAPATLGSTGGIWNDVLLESTGMETIRNQYVDTKLSPDNRRAELSFNYEMANFDSTPKEVTVEVRYAPAGTSDQSLVKSVSKKVVLQPGSSKVTLKAVENEPKLWWTYDHGEPSLYEMETSIREGDRTSDSVKGHFGIRSLHRDEKTGVLELNGKPVYQRGTNYIPTEWLSTYDESKYMDDIEEMKEAHLNAVRVHASVLPQEFYDAADREGMLVWADFPMIWGMSASPSFVSKARKSYADFIEMYRNHPSIWTWSAHNEPYPYNLPMDYLMKRDAGSLDPSRSSKASSGFTEHFYPGWYSTPYGGHYTDINRWKPGLPSEFGAQAIPKSIKDVIPKDSQWPIEEHEEAWRFHDMQPENSYKYIGHPKAFQNLDDYIETSQKYQYDYTKYVVEYFRRLKYKPDVGMYQFMFKDAWPSDTWAVNDDRNNHKMAFQALKEAMNPELVSIEWKKTRFRPGEEVAMPVWVINDNWEPLGGTSLSWALHRPGDEKPIFSGEDGIDSEADSSKAVRTLRFRIPRDANPGEKWILDVHWTDRSGKELSSNVYMFGTETPAPAQYRYEPVCPSYPEAG